MARIKKVDTSEFVVMGSEPEFKGKITSMQLCRALNWYNHFYSPTTTKPRDPECVEWIIEYMKSKKYSRQDIQTFSQVPNKEIPTTLCSLARILNRGAIFKNNLDERIKHLIDMEQYRKPVTVKKEKIEIRRPNPVIASLDELLDTFFNSEYRVVPDLTNIEVLGNKEEVSFAAQYYTELLEELNDKEIVKESYASISALGMKRYRALVQSFIDLLSEKKQRKSYKPRKPRTKKKKSANQLVSLLRYKQAEKIGKETYESVDPIRILEATIVWTYNARKRLLTKYVSTNPLQVHRTTLKGFDPKLSFAKKIRKPEITIKSFATEGKATISKMFDKIKAREQKVNGRMNEETIILRTFK